MIDPIRTNSLGKEYTTGRRQAAMKAWENSFEPTQN
jgi:hypothetical protein